MFHWSARRVIAAVALLALTGVACGASVLFYCPFDKDSSASGTAGFAVAGEPQITMVRGRLDKAALVAKGVGPVLYSGKGAVLPSEGSISFWFGSSDLQGSANQTVNLVSVKSDGALIQIYKGSDGFLYVSRSASGAVECYRYPIYDLQPSYSNPWNKGSGDIRHFICYQWGGKNSGLLVNAVPADKTDAAAAPKPSLELKDGQIGIGDACAGLTFDEVLIADSQRTQPEVRDIYISYLTGSYQLPLAEVSVTERQGKPIVIDGSLDDEAWSKASIIGNVHELQSKCLLPVDANLYVTYDSEKIYLGLKTYGDYPMVSSTGRNSLGEDTGICMDDALELMLMPYESIRYDYFHFLGNSAGHFADQLGTDINWDGHWDYKCQVKDGYWTAELAIPYGNMHGGSEKAQYPKGDAKWRFNYARNWDGVFPFHWAALSYCGNYGDYGKFALMSFEKDGVSPRFGQITQSGDDVHVKLEVVNNGSKSRSIKASAFGVASILPFTETRQEFQLAAGERKQVDLVLPLKGVTNLAIEWAVNDAENGRYLLRGSGSLPFMDPPVMKKAVAKVAKTDEPAKTATDTKSEPKSNLWPDAKAVEDALAKRLQWKNNKLGYSEKVPPPWTPVAENDGVVSVWNRAYSFKNALFLGQASANGQDMLAGPVALVIEKAGKQVRYEKATTTVTDKKDTRVDLIAVGGDDKVILTTRTWVEYDGCAWTELRILPRTAVSFDKMWIEIPCKTAAAANYSYWIDKESGSYCGKMPVDGISATYRPYVWVGDVARGFCWFNQECRDFFIEEPEKTVMTFIEPGQGKSKDVTRVKIMVGTSPNTLDKPMGLEFGMMATPVKPMLKNWRMYEYSWDFLKGSFAQWGTGYFIKEPDDPEDFARRLKDLAAKNPYQIATPNCGSYFFTETNYKDGRAYPDYWFWGNEFSQTYDKNARPQFRTWTPPQGKAEYQVGYTTAIPSSEYTDLYLFNYNKLMTDYPQLRGVYMDTCIPVGNNPLNGTGYVDRYGKQHGTIQIMNSRNFMKRLYTMFWQMRGNPDNNPWLLFTHCSNQICPPVHSFVGAFLQGEGLSVGPRALGDHPLAAIPMDAMKVGYNGHTYGWIERFLGVYSSNPESVSELAAMLLINDQNVLDRGETRTGNRWASCLAAAGLRAKDDEITFIPYWDNKGAVISQTYGGYVNAYIKTKESRTILAVASLKMEDTPPTLIDVRFDRTKLALPTGPLVMKDLYTGETRTVTGDSVQIPIRKYDFRMLELKAGQ